MRSVPNQIGMRFLDRTRSNTHDINSDVSSVADDLVWQTISPAHKSVSTAVPSSSTRARRRALVVSPNAESSRPLSPPIPSPGISRPLLSRSNVTVSRAGMITRRRGSGVTIAPNRIRCVTVAIAASTIQGSARSHSPEIGLRTGFHTNRPVPATLIGGLGNFHDELRIRDPTSGVDEHTNPEICGLMS